MSDISKDIKRPVPLDTAAEIAELEMEGHGRNVISTMTGVPAGTVRSILNGTHKTFVNDLTIRQASKMLCRWRVVR